MRRTQDCPAQLPLVPQSVDIAKAIREGFYACRICFCVVTVMDGTARRCSRCKSPALKFHKGISE